MSVDRFLDYAERLNRQNRVIKVPFPRLKYRSNPTGNYNAVIFKQRYRLEKATASSLCDYIYTFYKHTLYIFTLQHMRQ